VFLSTASKGRHATNAHGDGSRPRRTTPRPAGGGTRALESLLSSVPPEVAARAASQGVIMPMTVYVEAEDGTGRERGPGAGEPS
jgi:hypothetical protein